jgi:transposase InsO family protein
MHKQPAAPLHPIPVPARKFSHVHVDLVGPLPASFNGHVYLMTIIDRLSRWFEAVPLRNMEASMCTDAFIANWAARFGVPATVTMDRGAQFTSSLWTAACTRLGIKHVLTTAYHPQSNGMVERVHRQLTDALRARGAGPAWHSHLPWVLMACVLHRRRILRCLLQGPLLAADLPRCRPLLQSSLHLRDDADWGGLLWRILNSR